ncbi:(Fe-S)-binding protein [Pseudonocardia nantongensis]|uniref:(Fe-S)-binding protein n=1 Tax=Pseudonocardia nantongensis TaxID=1181885 RepID=UPI0039782107
MAHTHDGATGPRPDGRRSADPSAPSAAVLTPPTGLRPVTPATPSVPQQRTPSEPAAPAPAPPAPPAEPDLRLCSCGHPEDMHEHYRPGTDCGACGARSCRAFHPEGEQAPARNPIRRILGRWTG